MLFIDREDSDVPSGVLYALLFGLVPKVRTLTDRETLRAVYDDFMVTNSLLGYVLSLPGRVFLLPGGSLTTTQAPMSGGPSSAASDPLPVVQMPNLLAPAAPASLQAPEDEDDLPDLE